MKCPFCGKSNPDKAKFCEECSSPLTPQNDIVDIVEAERVKEEKAVDNKIEKVKNVTIEKVADREKPKKESAFAGIIASIKKFFTVSVPTFFKNMGNKEYVKAHKKNYIAAGCTLVGVIAIVLVLCLTLGGSGGSRLPIVEDPYAVADLDSNTVTINGKDIKLEDGALNVKQAGDGTVVYMREDGALAMLDENGDPVILSESLYQYSITPGGLITFLGDEKDFNGESVCTLYYYNKNTGEIVTIAENVIKFSSIVSYDSSSIAYTQYTGSGYEINLIENMDNSMASVKIDSSTDGMTAQLLSNGGSLLVYEKCNGINQILCSYSSGSIEEIGSFEMEYEEGYETEDGTTIEGGYIFNAASIYTNSVGTEAFIIYYGLDNNSSCFYKKLGSPAVQISYEGLNPEFVEPKFSNSSIYSVTTRSCIAYYYPVDSFSGIAFKTTIESDASNNLYAYSTGASEATLVGEGVENPVLTGDMKTLSFIYGNELTTVSLSGGKVGTPSVLVEDAVVFDFNTDSSIIYYINYKMELYKITNSGTPELMAENINNTFCATDSAGNSVLYYTAYDQETGVGDIVKRTGSSVESIAKKVHFIEANGSLSMIKYYKNVTGSSGDFVGDVYTNNNGKESAGTAGVAFQG